MPPSLTTEAKTLKPCPFCGSHMEIVETERDDNDRAPRPHRVYQIECDACDLLMEATSSDYWSGSNPPPESENDRRAKARLVESWNRRTVDPSLLSIIEDMANELRRSSEHLKCFSDYHPEESTCDIAASLHCSRDLLSRYTKFMEQNNG